MHKHGCSKICPDVKSRSVFFVFFAESYFQECYSDPYAYTAIDEASRNSHCVVHFVQILFFFFSFSRAALLQTGISYLECRANIKRITATLPAIRANENFDDGRPAMCVRLGDFLKHALFGGPVLGEHRFHQHRHLSSCVRGAGTLGLGWTLRRRWLVR